MTTTGDNRVTCQSRLCPPLSWMTARQRPLMDKITFSILSCDNLFHASNMSLYCWPTRLKILRLTSANETLNLLSSANKTSLHCWTNNRTSSIWAQRRCSRNAFPIHDFSRFQSTAYHLAGCVELLGSYSWHMPWVVSPCHPYLVFLVMSFHGLCIHVPVVHCPFKNLLILE